MLKRILTLLLINVVCSSALLAQQTPSNAIEVNLQKVISKFTSKYKLIGDAYGGEVILHLNRQNDQKPWMKALNLTSIDLIYNYKRMEDVQLDYYPYDGIFADSHALLAGLQMGLIRLKRAQLVFAPAVGVTYVNETYYTNRNPVLSSHLNIALKTGLKAIVPVSETLQFTGSLDIYHYSNGAYRVANNGMNVASVGLGVAKNISTPNRPTTNIHEEYDRPRHNLDFGFDMGRRGIFRSKKGVFRNGLHVGYHYQLNSVLAIGTGIDAVYYHTVFDPDNYDYTHQSFGSSYDRFRVGAVIGPDLLMGKLAAVFRWGYYLHYNSLTGNKTYWTGGLRYSLNDWLSVQSKLYLHGTEADYLGFGAIFSKRFSHKR